MGIFITCKSLKLEQRLNHNADTAPSNQSLIHLLKIKSSRGDLNTYMEMDFFAFQSLGNERVSNSYAPRLRHAFGSLGSFLAEQT